MAVRGPCTARTSRRPAPGSRRRCMPPYVRHSGRGLALGDDKCGVECLTTKSPGVVRQRGGRPRETVESYSEPGRLLRDRLHRWVLDAQLVEIGPVLGG